MHQRMPHSLVDEVGVLVHILPLLILLLLYALHVDARIQALDVLPQLQVLWLCRGTVKYKTMKF